MSPGPFSLHPVLQRTHRERAETCRYSTLPNAYQFYLLKPKFVKADLYLLKVLHVFKTPSISYKIFYNIQRCKKCKSFVLLLILRRKQTTENSLHFPLFLIVITSPGPYLTPLPAPWGESSPCRESTPHVALEQRGLCPGREQFI